MNTMEYFDKTKPKYEPLDFDVIHDCMYIDLDIEGAGKLSRAMTYFRDKKMY